MCVHIPVFLCVCERTRGGDSRYLRPTDRHLALRQPQTTRPYGMLRNVTRWHYEYTVCVCVCVYVGVFVRHIKLLCAGLLVLCECMLVCPCMPHIQYDILYMLLCIPFYLWILFSLLFSRTHTNTKPHVATHKAHKHTHFCL